MIDNAQLNTIHARLVIFASHFKITLNGDYASTMDEFNRRGLD